MASEGWGGDETTSLAPESISVFCALPSKAQGCWYIDAWAAFGWTKGLGDVASRQGGNNKNKSTETGICWACVRGQLMRSGLGIQVRELEVQRELRRQTWPVWLPVTENSSSCNRLRREMH